MPAKSFLRRVSGRFTEILGTVVSAGATNAGDIVALNDSGTLDNSVLPSGTGPIVAQAAASEAIAAGAFVNLYLNAGVLTARNADNTAEGKEVNGFALAAIASGASGTINLSGTNNQLSGLTIGSRYYLGTAGAVTTTAATGVGKIDQCVGKAISATAIAYRSHDYVVKAA